jgi:predicted metal-dependent phosphoesterase TrpH
MIDLHVHSTFSDGSLTPEQLVDEAERIGLSALALTDHDSLGGIPRFLRAAAGRSVRAVPGVEISADFNPGTMHMLGYFVGHEDDGLERKLRRIREGREERNREILRRLNGLGFAITWEEVKSFAQEDVVGRPHFAQALIARGYVGGKDEAFDRYLGKGKPAYADRWRLNPEESVRMIRESGGVPVLAHPFTLQRKREELWALVSSLREKGLEGVEVYYPEHTSELQSQYLALARSFGLVATGGSDFHGALAPDIRMGTGFGSLRVPPEAVEQLDARRPR